MLPIDPQYKRRHWGQIFFFFFFAFAFVWKHFNVVVKIKLVLRVCETDSTFIASLHTIKKKDNSQRRKKKNKRKRVRQNWFESKVRAGRVLIFTVRRDRGRNHMVILLFHAWFCFRFLIGSWKMNIKGRRASERFLVHFFFLFLWFQIQYRFISNQ